MMAEGTWGFACKIVTDREVERAPEKAGMDKSSLSNDSLPPVG